MNKLKLNKGWKLYEVGTDLPIDIKVPGDVNDALREAGLMPDPRYDTNARECYFVTSKEWEYRLSFDYEVSGKTARLRFTGIDGTAEVFLNGESLGKAQNAHHPYVFEVTDKLHSGENTIAVKFAAIDDLLGPRLNELQGWYDLRGWLRKPMFNFGWDWSIPVPSLGLSGDVVLETNYDCELLDYSINTYTSGRIDFAFEVSDAAVKSDYSINVHVHGNGYDETFVVKRRAHKSYKTIYIDDPKLWYPLGYGEHPLYNYEIDLVVGGETVQSVGGRFGIRQVEILEEPFTEDAGVGYSFWLVVNGIRVFCKGGNWIPLELWPATVKTEDYEYYVKATADANFNMQRIWGGGIYEHDRFYELCDEYGIMVWEDFMFASTGYPLDMLRDEIITEATYQIRRLRNHPCIAIWCGCNEDIYSWTYAPSVGIGSGRETEGIAPQRDMNDISRQNGSRESRIKNDPILYSMILRGLVSKLCPGMPYVESSPASREDAGNSPESGNCHISAWKFAIGRYYNAKRPEDKHNFDWRRHFDKICSFDSEFCDQGPCSEKLLRSFLKPEHHWPPDEAWIYHIQRGHFNAPHYDQTLAVAGDTFGEITNLTEYVKFGQATHLEMMRAEFDSARADYPNNGGTMMWMFNDCWPTSNWSIITYDKVKKPCYYSAKRACAPVCPIIFARRGMIKVLVSNQSGREVKINAKWGWESFDGEVYNEKTGEAVIKPCENAVLDLIPESEKQGDYLYLQIDESGEFTKVIYFVDYWRDLKLPEPKYTLTYDSAYENNGKWTVKMTVKAETFVRLFHLIPKNDSLPVLSDNYFDLTKGEVRKLTAEFDEKPDENPFRCGDWLGDWE